MKTFFGSIGMAVAIWLFFSYSWSYNAGFLGIIIGSLSLNALLEELSDYVNAKRKEEGHD